MVRPFLDDPSAAGLDTPVIVVDLDRADARIAAMAAVMGERGVTLRPHAKTHKSLEFGRRQIAAGAVGLTVATIGEAEVFAEGGIDDLFIAYPVPVGAVGAPCSAPRRSAPRRSGACAVGASVVGASLVGASAVGAAEDGPTAFGGAARLAFL